MKKSVNKAVLYLTAFFVCTLAAECAWFEFVLSRPRPAMKADILAIYGGGPERYTAGWRFEQKGHFRYLVYSDASPSFVSGLDHSLGPPHFARQLLEPNARSTAQNARYVAQLIKAHGCRSILVVTSWWHMPRALFLTHLALLGRGISIEGLSVDKPSQPPWHDPRLWIESACFWGSLLTYQENGSPAGGTLRLVLGLIKLKETLPDESSVSADQAVQEK